MTTLITAAKETISHSAAVFLDVTQNYTVTSRKTTVKVTNLALAHQLTVLFKVK